MAHLNLGVGWAGILAGLLLGAGIGLFFHQADWLGGYGGWRRRMLRLSHIALIGTGLLNILFALSVSAFGLAAPPHLASILFVVGAISMPTVCALSAWRMAFRHLFFIPVVSLVVAVGEFVYRGLVT